ncbi:MAG TPA: YbhB/YbcL family Raf kinase inhibitor-like protein [Phenylobacterium sp.]|nr:YbhB/YbcL family Raf kinase inhibitor-like protein [Phenylobacterium sp.]
MTFALHSPVFQNGGAIPEKYARDGDNISPPLRWSDPPAEAKSFILVVEDPDAPSGTFRHWAIHGINPSQAELREGVGAESENRRQAVNDFGKARYDGPQPPPGHGVHHYHFRIAALDVPQLDIPAEANAERVWDAARPHVIDQTELVGTYER